MTMEEFLKASKQHSEREDLKVRVVLGNPSCDLDSAVCAIVQGYFEKELSTREGGERDLVVLPVMNVSRREFRVKTEVVFSLRRCQVPEELLTFRDEVNLEALRSSGRLELVLVDHHTLTGEDVTLADCVVEVLDHRPHDPEWPWTGRKLTLERVGSCATLVARNLLKLKTDVIQPTLALLLLGPILIDTANFSKEADRATPLDHEMAIQLGELCGMNESSRTQLFEEILQAKTDISGLSADDLLIRDLKVVNGVPISGFPILVKEFLQLDGAREALEAFCSSRSSLACVLVGMRFKDASVKRDLAVYSPSSHPLACKLIEALLESSSPSLQLTEAKLEQQEASILAFGSRRGGGGDAMLAVYEQANVRATRKQILPIVQSASGQTT